MSASSSPLPCTRSAPAGASAAFINGTSASERSAITRRNGTSDTTRTSSPAWRDFLTRSRKPGRLGGGVKVAKQQGGFLSVCAGASTDTGGSIQQQIIRAYGLR